MDIHKMQQMAYQSIVDLDAAVLPQWQAILDQLDLSINQAEILTLLAKSPQPIGQLSKNLGITSSAVTQIVENLEKRKLVVRRHQTDDRRVVNVVLLSKGQAASKKLKSERKKLIKSLFSGLCINDLQTIIMIFNKMIKTSKGQL